MSTGPISRRVALGAVAGAGAAALGGRLLMRQPPGDLPHPASEGGRKSTHRPGGRIRVASTSTSTGDTLDPAKGAVNTDYVRHFMLYSGLTEFDRDLSARPALAESI